jgi:hypothetical protein
VSLAAPAIDRPQGAAADRPRVARGSPGCAARHASEVDEAYFLGRMKASQAMAEAAGDALAKLVHFDLAGRYSIAARRAAARR